jgi:hypothetical protein
MYLDLRTTPQEQLATSLGSDQLRQLYTDWAAANTAGFTYVDPAKVDLSKQTFESFANAAPAGSFRPFAIDVSGPDPTGTFAPEAGFQPGAWAYNVARFTNPTPGSYTFTLDGSPTGDLGTAAHFDATVVIRDENGGVRNAEVTMTDPVSGQATVEVADGDAQVLVVITSVPDLFDGSQTFDYSLTVAGG